MELLGDPGIGGGWWQVICFAVVLALWHHILKEVNQVSDLMTNFGLSLDKQLRIF